MARELAGITSLHRAAELAARGLPTPLEAPAAEALRRAADLEAEAIARSMA